MYCIMPTPCGAGSWRFRTQKIRIDQVESLGSHGILRRQSQIRRVSARVRRGTDMWFRYVLVLGAREREEDRSLRSKAVSRWSYHWPCWKTLHCALAVVRCSDWCVACSAAHVLSVLESRQHQQNLYVAFLLETSSPTTAHCLCSPRISSCLLSPALFQDLPMMARHFTHKAICSWTFARSGPAVYSPRCCHKVPAASTIGKMKSQGNRSRSSTYWASMAEASCAAAMHARTGMCSGASLCAGDQLYSRQNMWKGR